MSAIKSKSTSRAARTPAQQAIIDEMRKGMSAEQATAKVTEHVDIELKTAIAARNAALEKQIELSTAAQAEHAEAHEAAVFHGEDGIDRSPEEVLDEMMAAMAPSRRDLVALVASCFVAGGVGYAGGTLIGYALAGAVTLGAGAFTTMIIAILGVALTMYAARIVARVTVQYIESGSIDEDYAKVKRVVTGWYDSAKSLVVRTPSVA